MQNGDIEGLVSRGQSELAGQAREFVNNGYRISTEEAGTPEQAEPHVRNFKHRGHEVNIVTNYEITIDGQQWQQNIQVLQNGTVHYHGLPQANLPSAVDLIKAVIDAGIEAPQEILDAKAGK